MTLCAIMARIIDTSDQLYCHLGLCNVTFIFPPLRPLALFQLLIFSWYMNSYTAFI